jgi:hypothetical protein
MKTIPATLDEAEAQLSSAVYDACALFERLETRGLVRGNGHHLQQAVAHFAVEKLKERWQAPVAAPPQETASTTDSA